MKLLAVGIPKQQLHSFITHGRHYQTLKADNWLVHEDEFYVHWVGESGVYYLLTTSNYLYGKPAIELAHHEVIDVVDPSRVWENTWVIFFG